MPALVLTAFASASTQASDADETPAVAHRVLPPLSHSATLVTLREHATGFEGKLADVRLFGFRTLRLERHYIVYRLGIEIGAPLNIAELQQSLRRLAHDPRIARLDAELTPAIQPGSFNLNLGIEEAPRYHGGLSLDNSRSPSIGEIHLGGWWRDGNVSRWGDALTLRLGVTKGLKDGGLNYVLPVSRRDDSLTLSGSHSESAIIEEPFNVINITSTTDSLGLQYESPLIRTGSGTLAAALALEKRRSKSLLDGQPFQFSPGANNGVARVTVLRAILSWLHQTSHSVLAIRSRLSSGLKAFDATDNRGDTPDGRFLAWFGQFQWVRRIGKTDWVLRLEAQRSRDKLLALEKYGLGGAHSVRGYRENLFVRDQGWLSSIEGRYRLKGGQLQLALFYDAGAARNLGAGRGDERLASLGLGLRARLPSGLAARIDWGRPLKSIDIGPNRRLQDNGLHFSLEYRF